MRGDVTRSRRQFLTNYSPKNRLVEAVKPAWVGRRSCAWCSRCELLSSASGSSYGATSWNLRQCRRAAFRSELIGGVQAYAQGRLFCCTADVDVLFHCLWQEKNNINLHLIFSVHLRLELRCVRDFDHMARGRICEPLAVLFPNNIWFKAHFLITVLNGGNYSLRLRALLSFFYRLTEM